MASDNVLPPSLPPTVTARRNARLRAGAIATLPLLLFLLAAALRLWEPDLVPFGLRQAEYVSAENARPPLTWATAYADLSVTPFSLLQPLLRETPAPVVVWVAVRGLLDSLGAAFLFLAARPLVGVWGAALAGLLYALNPSTWAAARDPAGPLTAMLMTVALWAAVRLVQRPTLWRGAMLGLALGLLARSETLPLVVVALGAAALAFGRASWKVGGLAALVLVVCAGPALVSLPSRAGAGFTLQATGMTLAAPGWLVYGLAYQSADAQAVGTTFLPVSALAVVIPLGLFLAASAVVALWLGRQGQRTAPLLLGWLLIAWVAARPLLTPRYDTGNANYQFAFPDPAATVALWPLFALLLVAPIASSHRWIPGLGTLGSLLALAVSCGTIGLSMHGISSVAAAGQAFTIASAAPGADPNALERPDVHWRATGLAASWPRPLLGGSTGVGLYATLRDWSALATAASEVAARIEADELLVVAVRGSSIDVRPLAALLGGRVRVREVERVVLPLEREVAYIVTSTPPSALLPLRDLRAPSSALAVFTATGADVGARILTLRPRTEADWLARAELVERGQFSDGSTLVAYDLDHEGQVATRIRLYWRLPIGSQGQPHPVRVSASLPDSCLEIVGDSGQTLMESRRAGELTVVGFAVRVRDGSPARSCVFDPREPMLIELADAARNVIPWTGGSPRMPVPLRREAPPPPPSTSPPAAAPQPPPAPAAPSLQPTSTP